MFIQRRTQHFLMTANKDQNIPRVRKNDVVIHNRRLDLLRDFV